MLAATGMPSWEVSRNWGRLVVPWRGSGKEGRHGHATRAGPLEARWASLHGPSGSIHHHVCSNSAKMASTASSVISGSLSELVRMTE